MSKKKKSSSQGSNPGRVAAIQQLLRSGAYGTHKQTDDRTRAEVEREAIEDFYDSEDD